MLHIMKINILCDRPLPLKINLSGSYGALVADCIKAIETSDNPNKQKAMIALRTPKGNRYFGPLLDGGDFSIPGKMTSGKEILGRIWDFIQKIQDEKDKKKCYFVFDRGFS